MAISKKITKYLEDNKYKYDVIGHRTTFTAWDTAQTEHVKPQEVVKALAIKADSDYVLALLPSNKNLDKKKLLKIINARRKESGEKAYKKIEFAKEAWMKKNLPGKVGATPPFAGFTGLTIYIDGALKKNKKIYLGSGEYTESVRVNTSEYVKKENPVAGAFSVSKK